MVVVGAGAAGMSGAKIAARMRRRLLVINSAATGATAGSSIHMDLMGEDIAAAVTTHRARSTSAQRTGRAMDTGHQPGTSSWVLTERSLSDVPARSRHR